MYKDVKDEATSEVASIELKNAKSTVNTNISLDGNPTKYSTVPNEYSRIQSVSNASNELDNSLCDEMSVAIDPDENSKQSPRFA